jgi:hypothetical protein
MFLSLIPVPEDKTVKGVVEEDQPLLSPHRSIIPIYSRWALVRKVVMGVKVVNTLRRYRR